MLFTTAIFDMTVRCSIRNGTPDWVSLLLLAGVDKVLSSGKESLVNQTLDLLV